MSIPLPYVYLNGDYLALEKAKISVLDRGFLFGDGVYEVIPTYTGKLFELDAHLKRLAYSLSEIQLANPFEDAQWEALLRGLARRNGAADQALYLQVTRGAAAGRDHAFPNNLPATVFAMSSELKPVRAETLARGMTVTTQDDLRWRRCDIKSTSLLGNLLLRQQALSAGVDESILLRDGYATEGTVTSLFVWHNEKLIVSPQGPDLLAGITRGVVLGLARRHGLQCRAQPISEGKLREADEIWLTSSTREVLPVTRLDGRAVGEGVPGPRWRQMHALFQSYKSNPKDISVPLH